MSTTAPEKSEIAGYLVLKEVTATNVNGDASVHRPHTILSPWELNDHLKKKIYEGSAHYRSLFEPLLENEVKERREQATAIEGDHVVDGQRVSPPWPDYVGLHPEEILQRLRTTNDLGVVHQVRLYEKGGLHRHPILEYVAPVEREPWIGYKDMAVRDVLNKFEALNNRELIAEAQAYEFAHSKRPAILTYEVETPVVAEPVAQPVFTAPASNDPNAGAQSGGD